MLFYILYFNYIWTFIILAVAAGIAAFIYFKKHPRIVALEEMKPSRKKDLLIGLRDNAGVFSELLEPLFAVANKRSGRNEWVMASWKEAVDSVEGYEEFKSAFEEKFFVLYGKNAMPPVKNKKASKEEKKVYKTKKKALKKIKKADKKLSKAARKTAKLEAKKNKYETAASSAKPKKQKKLAKKARKCEKKIAKINAGIKKADIKLYSKNAAKLIKLLLKAGIIRNAGTTYITADETTAEVYDTIGELSLEKDAVYDVHLPFWSLIVKRRDGLEELLAKAEAEETPVNADENKKPAEDSATVILDSEKTVTINAEEKTVTVDAEEKTVAAPAAAEAAPVKRADKKAAKKAAKKAKKKAKKAAKKDKKLNKKITKLESKLLKAKKEKKQAKIEKKIAGCKKRLSKNKELKKAIKALPVASTETLLSKGAIK